MFQQAHLGKEEREGTLAAKNGFSATADKGSDSRTEEIARQIGESLAHLCQAVVKQAAREAVEQSLLAGNDDREDLNALRDGLESVREEIRQIRETLGERLPKMAGLDELHAQHTRLLEDFWSRQVDTLFQGLVPILDRIEGRLWALNTRVPEETDYKSLPSEVAKFVKGIKVELLALLATHGIEPFTTGDDSFSGKWHQAVRFVKTNESSLEGAIVKRLRCGYRSNGRIIRQELVEVYQSTNNRTRK